MEPKSEVNYEVVKKRAVSFFVHLFLVISMVQIRVSKMMRQV